MKKFKKLAICIVISLAFVLSAVALTGCFLFGGGMGGLDNGTYRISRIAVNGQEVAENHLAWMLFNELHFVVEGSSVSQIDSEQTIVSDYRIRDGFFERRTPGMYGGRWVREDGTFDSGWISARVESDEIIARAGAQSPWGALLGGVRVYLFFTLGASVWVPHRYDSPADVWENPSAEDLFGKWYLVHIFTSNMGSKTPGHLLWQFTYFIDFAESTFQELNFWNPGDVRGTWTLVAPAQLSMTRTNVGILPLDFVGSRAVAISDCGVYLRITYTRTQQGFSWDYVMYYSPTAPIGGGSGGGF